MEEFGNLLTSYTGNRNDWVNRSLRSPQLARLRSQCAVASIFNGIVSRIDASHQGRF